MQKKRPTRMCIACRKRQSQNALIRLQLHEGSAIPYTGHGRSFYLCPACARDARRMRGIAKRLKIEPESWLSTLKELTTDGES
jgi:predicted RNA-binding protein YlxR (DUF448 family)